MPIFTVLCAVLLGKNRAITAHGAYLCVRVVNSNRRVWEPNLHRPKGLDVNYDQWLERSRVFTRNIDTQKVFVSGPTIDESDESDGILTLRGNHPDAPDDIGDVIEFYESPGSFLVHDACLFDILPKVIAHHVGENKCWATTTFNDIDHEVLFQCMLETSAVRPTGSLNLDCYELEKAAEPPYWPPMVGELVRFAFVDYLNSSDCGALEVAIKHHGSQVVQPTRFGIASIFYKFSFPPWMMLTELR